jgi:inward rectifier potassium channel
MAGKTKDIGFGYASIDNAKSMIDDKGSSNVNHVNRRRNINDLYTYFIDVSWFQFFLFIVLNYTLLNIIFAFIYMMVGIDYITPSRGNFLDDFLNGFFFSAQTLTTVGYGGLVPEGVLTNFVAAFEAMIGLLSFSFITGLLYGRFSKPKAILEFSEHLILRKFQGENALMFRLMNSRKTVMIEPEITVTLSISEKDKKGNFKRNFYKLKLEREKIMYLPTVWTVVHSINDESPLFKYSKEELKKLEGHLYLLVNYHEESFAQKVYKIHSYDFSSLKFDVKYVSATSFDEDGFTVLDHDKLSEVEKMKN